MNNTRIDLFEPVPTQMRERIFRSHSVKQCPTCTKLGRTPQMITSNDGKCHQKCLNCGWKWDAPQEARFN